MPASIGRQLKNARLARNLSIQKVVESIHIRPQYIEALEADNYEVFPSPAQGRGFLRNYSEFLGLKLEELYARQREQAPAARMKTDPAGVETSVIAQDEMTFPVSSTDVTFATPNTSPEIIAGEIKSGVLPISVKTEPISPDSSTRKAAVKSIARTKRETEEKKQKIILPKRKAVPGSARQQVKTTAEKTEAIKKDKKIKKDSRKTLSTRKPVQHKPAGLKGSKPKPPIEVTPEAFPPPLLISSVTIPPVDSNTEKVFAQEETTNHHLPVLTSGEIFLSIGSDLRRRRELLSMTLDEIEQHTHVRRHYLEAIELGEFERLPSSVQARGMINNFAGFLDMDADALLLRFAEGLQVQLQERHPPASEKHEKTRPRITIPSFIRRSLPIDLLFVGGLVVLFIIFITWGASRIISLSTGNGSQPTAPSISDVLLVSPIPGPEGLTGTPSGEPVILPATDYSPAISTQPTDGDTRVHVTLIALGRAMVVVTVDGQVKFDGRIVPDTAYPFDGNDRIEVLTGSGAAVKIIYNGTDMGVMGAFGQNVNFIYDVNTVMTPTPTSTPTMTASPLPSATLKPSATPLPSATPRYTPTPIP